MLSDGRYDALVIDAEPHGDDAWRVELTIVAGPQKGEVVSVRATRLPTTDELDLLGIPATLVVTDGEPTVRFEP